MGDSTLTVDNTTWNGPSHPQDKLGWTAMLEGVLTTQWQEQQDTFWQWIKSWWSANRWAAELIKKLWAISWDMWQHQNSALHKTQAGQELILEVELNTLVWQTYATGMQEIWKAARPPIIQDATSADDTGHKCTKATMDWQCGSSMHEVPEGMRGCQMRMTINGKVGQLQK